MTDQQFPRESQTTLSVRPAGSRIIMRSTPWRMLLAPFGPTILLACLLASCAGTLRMRPGLYSQPTTVSGLVTFAPSTQGAEIESQRLKNTRSTAGLLRRAYLELQMQRPQAALDTTAEIIFAAHPPSVHDESFARYLRAEAYRQQGHPERGELDMVRARALALDPDLQRRLRPVSRAKSPSTTPWGKLAIEPRSSWSLLQANRNNLDPMQKPRRVTIHHSAMYFRDTRLQAAASQLAGIQREHMQNRQYGDIGYHFLIDPSGRIWEGRKLRYQGAHASGANNIGNVGICILGNFVRQQNGQGPTNAQVKSMERLVVQLMRHYRFGGEALYCHSDFKNTACPGPRMQPIVRQFARQLRARGPLSTTPDEE